MVITSGRVFSIALVAYGGTLINFGYMAYFAVLCGIALLVFAAAFIVDRQVEPARNLSPAA